MTLPVWIFALTAVCLSIFSAWASEIQVRGKQFVLKSTGERLVPRGFNYDRDAAERLIETYWDKEWETLVGDFQEMKALGANTVRIHLQFSSFMKSPTEANRDNLRMLLRLLQLAETNRLYLDITGLGCYDKSQVPTWYNELSEKDRWNAQGRFWEFVAETCRNSPAVFCYDLMNEPIVTAGKVETNWLGGALGKFYYVQRINLDPAGRTQKETARAWVEKLVSSIRRHDKDHLITVGAIPWAMAFPNAKPLFYSPEVSEKLDFVSVHFYPKGGQVEKALDALDTFAIGKPVVIEEMFPLSCSVNELDEFIKGSQNVAAGWIGFYWGKTIEEYERQKDRNIADELTVQWLRYFQQNALQWSGED